MMDAMPRLFIAAWPPPEAAARLDALPRPQEPGVRWAPPENRHITLRFLGDVALDDVTERLATVQLPHCVARLGPEVGRLGARQIVIPATGVDALAKSTRAATADIGEPDRFAFRGHLTIARTKPNASSAVIGQPFDASFDVVEIGVVASDLRPTGAVYTTVATFPTVE